LAAICGLAYLLQVIYNAKVKPEETGFLLVGKGEETRFLAPTQA
jgi:hypothetical protein